MRAYFASILILLGSVAWDAQADTAAIQYLNEAPLQSARPYLDTFIDFRSSGFGYRQGAKLGDPFAIGSLRIGSSFQGQYSNGGVTGTAADPGPTLAGFPPNPRGPGNTYILLSASGLAGGRMIRSVFHSGTGDTAARRVVLSEELGTLPLSIVFPVEQYAFGLRLLDMWRKGQRSPGQGPTLSIRIKAFNKKGEMIAELRFEAVSDFARSFVRCQYERDIAAVQITSSVGSGLALAEIAFESKVQPLPFEIGPDAETTDGFEFKPCAALLG